jgi:hypothetical protein
MPRKSIALLGLASLLAFSQMAAATHLIVNIQEKVLAGVSNSGDAEVIRIVSEALPTSPILPPSPTLPPSPNLPPNPVHPR